MRSALYAAVRTLLDDPRVKDLSDPGRLSTVVMLAKAPVASAVVRGRARDLAGWVGYSISHLLHSVIPELKVAGVAKKNQWRDDTGQTIGLELELLPLREARATSSGGPLAMLNKKELATLLRVCEAVTCPGWEPTNKAPTPPGFMAKRTGRDAATDRLAMLLLVLQARDDGRVRMAPGRVADGFRRADATVARELRCSLDDAVPVVDRLVSAGHLDLERAESGGRDRLRIPAVAAACARVKSRVTSDPQTPSPIAEVAPTQCVACADRAAADNELALSGDGWAQESFEDALAEAELCASGDHNAESAENAQARRGFEAPAAEPVSAALHARHPPVADLSGFGADDLECFSGSAVGGQGRLRERAGAGEGLTDQDQAAEATATAGPEASPLRGEKRTSSSTASTQRATKRTVFVAPAALPEDLVQVLAPLAPLWASIGRDSTARWLAGAVRMELARLRGLVGADLAERVLAERLQRRLDRQGPHRIADLQGWLLSRGLPQRTDCWTQLCDDGIRMDTGATCPSCTCLIGDRRALRKSVAASVASELPHLAAGARRLEMERRVHERVQHQAAMDLVRRERMAEQQVARQAALALERVALAAAEAARAAAPCDDCGVPEASGLCLVCSHGRTTRQLLQQAVDITLALRGDLDDPLALGALADRVEADSRGAIDKACARAESQDPASQAFIALTMAKQMLAQRRRSALSWLGQSEDAEAEAQHAFRVQMRRASGCASRDEAVRAARHAGASARERVAEDLLRALLADLAEARAGDAGLARRTDWEARCAELASQPLAEDLADRAADADLVGVS